MKRRWMLLIAGLVVCALAGISLVACDKGKPLSEMGAAKYVGSEKCTECHSRIAVTFRNTLHNKVMQDAKKYPNAIQGDFIDPEPVGRF